MTNEIIFGTQIASIIGFIVTVFVLYGILVNQKDATIQLLKEKNDFIADQLKNAKDQGPDQLAESLSKRVSIYEGEIERLGLDKEKNSEIIRIKEGELESLKKDAQKFNYQLALAKELMADFFCSNCGAPMNQREFHNESVYHNGRDIDIDHEFIAFDCGHQIVDGKTVKECPRPST